MWLRNYSVNIWEKLMVVSFILLRIVEIQPEIHQYIFLGQRPKFLDCSCLLYFSLHFTQAPEVTLVIKVQFPHPCETAGWGFCHNTAEEHGYVCSAAAAAAKSLQSCPTLCDPIHGSPPGSPVPGILQARTLEWVAISFSNAWKWKVKVKSLSCVWLVATAWTAAHQAPPSMGFSRQEYWSGLPLPSPDMCVH